MDTYPVMAEAMERTAARFGVTCDRIELLHLMKDSLSVCALEVSRRCGRTADEVVRMFRLEEARLMPFAGPVEYVPEVLRQLHARGTRNFLVTHRNRGALDMLGRFGLLPMFSGWVTHEDAFPRKPDPSGIRYLLRRHGLCPGSCRMVGDRPLDVQAGERAGMRGILLDRENLFSGEGMWQRVMSGRELGGLLTKESNEGDQ